MGALSVRLEHVAITCPEELEDQVVRWYQDVFELSTVAKPEGTRPLGTWFDLGDNQLHIQIDEHNPPKIAHFALLVDDLDQAVERLRAARCHIEQASTIPGRRRFFTRDPAGNRLEVVQLEEGSSAQA